jgi:hypothetical protein
MLAPGLESFNTPMWLANSSPLNWSELESPQFAAGLDCQLREVLQAQQPAYPAPLPLNHVDSTANTSLSERVYLPPVLQRPRSLPAPLQAASPTETFVSQYTGWSPSYPCTALSSTATTPGPDHGAQAEANELDVDHPQDDAIPWPTPEEIPTPIEHVAVACKIGECNRSITSTVEGTKRHLEEFHGEYYGVRGRQKLQCQWKRPRGDVCGIYLRRPNLAAHIAHRHF